ncbi:uncharacterized protein LOC116388981 [Anarrhichthys ocellatus]|uniref:uncharacterized protein LOC116388981 n=1 Tax=Anarrhichthys ocellatus TaxID=433405 RepID=UPI0012EE73AF|nr:uncharacterized protein LOC116388981 [Anarrhichthys ocellatus]
MNGLLFLLCCVEILAALLCGAAANVLSSQNNATSAQEDHSNEDSHIFHAPSKTNPALDPSSMSATLSPPTVSQTSKSHSTSRSPGPQPTTTSTSTTIDMCYRKECLTVFLVAGGLIIACTILLLSTLLLMCKVCQLSNRVKMLSVNGDLISTSEYWIGTAKKSKSAPETEAKETTVLMTDIILGQEDMGNGAAEEEAVKVKEDGQTGEEDKKEVGDTAKSEEATSSQSFKAGAAPSSKGTEGPKEEV